MSRAIVGVVLRKRICHRNYGAARQYPGAVMNASFFERHGGHAFMSRLVLDFYDRVLTSEQLNPYFARADMRRLVEHQAKFISSVTGGPAYISDDLLEEVHEHLDIDPASFDEMVGLMGQTLSAFGIEDDDREQVLEALRARKRYIVATGSG
jgi:hemoglobin